MRTIDADALQGKEVHGTIGDISGDFIPAFEIALAPTIGAAFVQYGRWVKRQGLDSCSECGAVRPYQAEADVIEYWPCNHCPNCGVKMEEDNEID